MSEENTTDVNLLTEFAQQPTIPTANILEYTLLEGWICGRYVVAFKEANGILEFLEFEVYPIF